MKMDDFISKHKDEIDSSLLIAMPFLSEVTDRQRALWVLEDSILLELAKSEGMKV